MPKVFIRNISWTTSDRSLEDAFIEFGKIVDAKLADFQQLYSLDVILGALLLCFQPGVSAKQSKAFLLNANLLQDLWYHGFQGGWLFKADFFDPASFSSDPARFLIGTSRNPRGQQWRQQRERVAARIHGARLLHFVSLLQLLHASPSSHLSVRERERADRACIAPHKAMHHSGPYLSGSTINQHKEVTWNPDQKLVQEVPATGAIPVPSQERLTKPGIVSLLKS